MAKYSKTKLNNISFSSSNRTSLNIPNTNSQNILNRKKESDDLNNFYLSDISENENSQLFDQIKSSNSCNFNEKLEKNANKKLKINLSVDSYDISNDKYLNTSKSVNKSEDNLSVDNKTNKSKLKIVERFLASRKKSTNNFDYKSRSNDIILIRI